MPEAHKTQKTEYIKQINNHKIGNEVKWPITNKH